MIDVFISHSSQDYALAEQVADLLRAALNLRSNAIRCTSVDGYRLPAGADSDAQIRKEVLQSKAFVGILSIASLASAYVLFELGARWGAGKPLAPLLAPGLTAHALKGPVAGLNALSCDSAPQLHQLIQELGSVLAINSEPPQAYQAKIDALMYSGAHPSPKLLPESHSSAAAESAKSNNTNDVGKSSSGKSDDEYADAAAIIKYHCEKEWPKDFQMRAYCIEEQRKAAATLKLGGPKDVPEDVFESIRSRCALEWPDDYTMRAYCETEQLEGYRKVTE
jgi:hypothetical protein